MWWRALFHEEIFFLKERSKKLDFKTEVSANLIQATVFIVLVCRSKLVKSRRLHMGVLCIRAK